MVPLGRPSLHFVSFLNHQFLPLQQISFCFFCLKIIPLLIPYSSPASCCSFSLLNSKFLQVKLLLFLVYNFYSPIPLELGLCFLPSSHLADTVISGSPVRKWSALISLFFFKLIYFLLKGNCLTEFFAVFCQTSTWISRRYTYIHTYIPSLLNLPPIPLPIQHL